MFDLKQVQAALQEQGLDAWLLYDFRGLNILAARITNTVDDHRSRRWFYLIPAQGEPKKLVHRIEPAALDALPGSDKTAYLRWQELDAGVQTMHLEAAKLTDAAFGVAWAFMAEQIRQRGYSTELDVQARIMKHFADNKMTTYSPPIVGVGPHSGDPHYSPTPETNSKIEPNSFVLVDLWAKMDKPRAVYSDLTRTGYVGENVPA